MVLAVVAYKFLIDQLNANSEPLLIEGVTIATMRKAASIGGEQNVIRKTGEFAILAIQTRRFRGSSVATTDFGQAISNETTDEMIIIQVKVALNVTEMQLVIESSNEGKMDL